MKLRLLVLPRRIAVGDPFSGVAAAAVAVAAAAAAAAAAAVADEAVDDGVATAETAVPISRSPGVVMIATRR